jgi:transposase-like protein
LVSQGKTVAEAIRSIGVTEVTYYRWRQEFGGLSARGEHQGRATPDKAP